MNNYLEKYGGKINTFTIIIALSVVFFLMFYWTDKFFDQFNVRSFIILQNPIVREKADRLSIEPLPTKKPTPTVTPTPKKTIKSQEGAVKGQILPYPKYLTDNGAKNREKILAWASQRFSGDDLIALDNLLKKEAGYREDAVNEIGACGIGQALPCEKMGCPLDQSGLECQFNWVVKYITNRYGTPSKAWDHHLAMNWY